MNNTPTDKNDVIQASQLRLSLDNYISDECSICREERQYALFLCNVLKKYGKTGEKPEALKKIFTICHIPERAEIKDVFYEATFMRDIFTRNRRMGELIHRIEAGMGGKKPEDAILSDKYKISMDCYPENGEYQDFVYQSFNRKLLNFLQEKDHRQSVNEDVYEKNIGHHEWIYEDLLERRHESHRGSKQRVRMAKYMMNSKPDIAVIYKENENVYLLFLECKFESGEGKMECNTEAEKGISQTDIQYLIAKFICDTYGNYEDQKLHVAPEMEKEKASVRIKFTRHKKYADKQIYIRELIDFHEAIFR